MTSTREEALGELTDGPVFRFADWPNPAVPNGKAGAYTIWQGDQLIYVGMAGRALGSASDPTAGRRLTGLRSRLDSHASGRRSGDQFCVYVFDRLVLASLSRIQIEEASAGRLSLDRLTRDHIRGGLSYRFTLTADAETARRIERLIQGEGLAGHLPIFNPILPGRAGSVTDDLRAQASSQQFTDIMSPLAARLPATDSR